MKLWLLKAKQEWKPWCDKMTGIVVAAPTVADARQLANSNGADEVRDHAFVWLDDTLTTCEELTNETEARVILRDVSWA